MLILARKTDERLLIGDGIELVVLSVQGNRVRLGIQARAEISIRRKSASQMLTPAVWSAQSNLQEFCPVN